MNWQKHKQKDVKKRLKRNPPKWTKFALVCADNYAGVLQTPMKLIQIKLIFIKINSIPIL